MLQHRPRHSARHAWRTAKEQVSCSPKWPVRIDVVVGDPPAESCQGITQAGGADGAGRDQGARMGCARSRPPLETEPSLDGVDINERARVRGLLAVEKFATL
jgi:hypothetical protein